MKTIVPVSGGKDSQVVLSLAEPVAWRENAPPPETRNDQTCGD